MTALILDHVRQEALDMLVRAVNVNVKHGQVIFKWIVLEFAPHGNTSILNDNVKFFALFFQSGNYLICGFLNFCVIGHVKLENLDFLWIYTCLFDSLKFGEVSG